MQVQPRYMLPAFAVVCAFAAGFVVAWHVGRAPELASTPKAIAPQAATPDSKASHAQDGQEPPVPRALLASDEDVVICLGNGSLVFPPLCSGDVRIDEIQPIKNGEVIWRTGKGQLVKNSADEADYRAVWDPDNTVTSNSGRKITLLDTSDADLQKRVQAQMVNGQYGEANLIFAFSVDLVGLGQESIVFLSNNVQAAATDNGADGKPHPYVILAGVLNPQGAMTVYYHEAGEYLGATDAIGKVSYAGLTRIDEQSKEFGVVLDVAWPDERRRHIFQGGHVIQ